MIRVSTMMLGEIDFLNTFLQPMRQRFSDHNHTAWTQMAAATWFLMIFAILMPILLMNLLIGLAVGDIETVRRNASMKRLAMQVEHHTDLERRLPKQVLKYVRKSEVYEYPNKRSHQCATTVVVIMLTFATHSGLSVASLVDHAAEDLRRLVRRADRLREAQRFRRTRVLYDDFGRGADPSEEEVSSSATVAGACNAITASPSQTPRDVHVSAAAAAAGPADRAKDGDSH